MPSPRPGTHEWTVWEGPAADKAEALQSAGKADLREGVHALVLGGQCKHYPLLIPIVVPNCERYLTSVLFEGAIHCLFDLHWIRGDQ